MAIEKVIDINVKGNADEAVGSLRSQLRAAQADVAALSDKFGATSKEAVEAAKRAGVLKDKIGDAKALTDAFNPDAKFKALSSSLAGVASGFAAVQGGLGLIGVQGKDVEATLLKVQSAMALSAGLQQVGEARDSFKQLIAVAKNYSVIQKVITAAQWLWNAAMAANPIGAIVVAITALIAGGYALVKMFKESTAANEVAMTSIKAHTKELENQAKQAQKSSDAMKDNNGHLYDMAKAAGASTEELRKLAIQHANEDVALAKSNATIAANTFNRERNTLATLKAAGASDEVIEAQQKLTNASYKEFQEQDKILVASYKNRKEVIQKNEVEVLQEKTNATKKANDDAKSKAEALAKIEKENNEKRLKELKEFNESVQKGQIDLQIATNEAEFNQRILDQEAQDEKIRLLNEGVEEIAIAEAAAYKIKEENSLAATQLAEKEAAAKEALLNKTSSTATKAAELLGKNTLAGKALSIAAATINTYQGITAELATKTVTPFEIGLKIANVAIIAATGFKAVKDIVSVKVPGAGGGGGSAPSLSAGISGGTGASSAPKFNVVGNSGVNQLAGVIAGKENTPVKAFVVAQDVTTGQGLNRNIIESATLG